MVIEFELRISGTMENLFHFEGEGAALKRPSALSKALECLGQRDDLRGSEAGGAELPEKSS